MNDQHDDSRSKPERPICPNPEQKSQDSAEEGLPNIGQDSDKKKKRLMLILMGIFFIYAGYSIFWHKTEKKVVPMNLQKKEVVRPNYNPEKRAVSSLPQPVMNAPQVQEKNAEQAEIIKMKMALLAQREKVYRMRQNASIDLFEGGKSMNLSDNTTSLTQSSEPQASSKGRLPLSDNQIAALSKANDKNSAFQSQAEKSVVETVEASKIPYPEDTITQGTMIFGVLHPAVNSDLPGQITGNVSQDVYSTDGRKKLIPKGSKLIGEYESGLMLGQERLMVMWTRIIRPDNVSVMLGSPGTDKLGRAGMGADVLHTHFLERFLGATMVTIAGGAIATTGVSPDTGYNSASEYRMVMSQNFQQGANAALLSNMNIPPTIEKYQGSAISIYVNRDISFHQVNEEGSHDE